MEEVPQLSVYRTSLCLPATARAYAQESIPDDFARSPPRPRAPLSLGIPNGTALDRLSATRQASSQSTEYLNGGGL